MTLLTYSNPSMLAQHWFEERAGAHPIAMSLDPGTSLGPYEVTAKIGEGGMDI